MTDQDQQNDQAILAVLTDRAALTTVEQVVEVMQALDSRLRPTDGVKWFNVLYLRVTQAVYEKPPANGWADAPWLNRLDVTFAQLYFDALARWHTDPTSVPHAWVALFEARYRPDIERVQFALAGMNAHINHDLPLALVHTCEALDHYPQLRSRSACQGGRDGHSAALP